MFKSYNLYNLDMKPIYVAIFCNYYMCTTNFNIDYILCYNKCFNLTEMLKFN